MKKRLFFVVLAVGVIVTAGQRGAAQEEFPFEIFGRYLEPLAQQIGMPKLNWPGFIVMASLACSLYLLVSYFIKPFYMEERDRLNRRLFKRRVFIW